MFSRRSRIMHSVASLALALPTARAQNAMPILTDSSSKSTATGARLPAYDVSSVKPNKSDEHMMRIMSKPDGFSCTNIPLTTLIGNAFGIRQDLISGGPGWADSTGFDVEAKVAGPDVETFKKLSGRERNSLLQALLEDRFKLKLHHETKVLPMYDLVIAKGGPKLKAAIEASADDAKTPEAPQPHGMMTMGPGMFKGQDLSMAAVANQLSYILQHTVADKTGLSGSYDLDLKWTPEDSGPASGDAAEAGVSLFTAVQEQLGLKLQSTKGPTETLVIDHAEMPSEN